MGVMSIRDYAIKHGVTYQAIWKTVKKYETELEGHILTQNKTKFLDDEAQMFLDDKRKVNPIVIIEEASKDEIDRLIKRLEEQDRTIRELQSMIIQLQDDKMELIAEQTRAELYLEDKQKTEEKLVSVNEELTNTKIKLAEFEKEANSYKKSVFGLYKKI